MDIRTITLTDAEYPKNLQNMRRPPKELYVNGAFLPQDDVAVGIVGSRRATPYGLEMAERFAFELAASGVTVVSGMARGIDSAAHRGALKAKGRTIAVMGSGHGRIYPPENEALYREIASQGAVVTEFAYDEPPLPQHFPARNRIISGLSLGLLVVEAARNSGALITADFAAEQGREIFAVPGKVSSQTSAGTNDLIRDGARLVTSVGDILEELKIIEIGAVPDDDAGAIDGRRERKTKAYIYNALTDPQRKVYKALTDEPAHIDAVVASAGLDHSTAVKALVELQLRKLVKELPGKQYIRTEN